MEMKKLWLFIGVSFIAGFIWGRVIKEISTGKYTCQKYYLWPVFPYGDISRKRLIIGGSLSII